MNKYQVTSGSSKLPAVPLQFAFKVLCLLADMLLGCTFAFVPFDLAGTN